MPYEAETVRLLTAAGGSPTVTGTADVYALALVPAVLWGFEPIVAKRGLEAGGGSMQAALTVVVVSSLIFWGGLFAFDSGSRPLALVSTGAIVVFILAGLIGTVLGRVGYFVGVHRVGASVTSAGISVRPLFATFIAFLWLGEPVFLSTGVGIVVLVIGLVVLTVSKGGDLEGWRAWELVFPVATALAFALGNVIRRFGLTTTDITTLQAVAINETAALAGLLVYVLATRGRSVLTAPRESYGYFLVSGLLSAVALLAMFEAFNRGRVAIVDPLVGVAPLFTTIFAAMFLREVERVTVGVVVGALLIVVGGGLIVVS